MLQKTAVHLTARYPNLWRITQNVVWLGADNALRLFIGLLVTAWMARYLGPEQFGAFSFALAFVAFFTPFVSLGLETIVVRELVSTAADEQGRILSTAFFVKLAGGVLAFVLCFFSTVFLSQNGPHVRWMIFIISIGIVFQSLDIIDLYYQSRLLSKYTIWAKNSAFLLMSMVRIVLIIRHASVEAFAVAAMLEIVLGGLNMLFLFSRQKIGLRIRFFSCSLTKRFLQESSFMFASAFMFLCYSRIDQVLVGKFLGNTFLGVYSAVIRTSEMLFIIPMLLITTLFPLIVQYRLTNTGLYERKLGQFYFLLMWMTFFIALLVSLLSDKIILLLYGTKFILAGELLRIHVWVLVFLGVGVANTFVLIAERKATYNLMRTMIAGVFSLIVNVCVIPVLGLKGAVIVSLISYGIATFIIGIFPGARDPVFFMIKSMFCFPGQTKKI